MGNSELIVIHIYTGRFAFFYLIRTILPLLNNEAGRESCYLKIDEAV